MPAVEVPLDPHVSAIVLHERRLQMLVLVYIATGLLFLLLPGTFLGVWNLISISSQHTVDTPSPAWIQAHGHAQIFGWLGTFIIGIGFYSLSKMGRLQAFALTRGWLSFGFWTAGVSLRWATNVTGWQWRWLLPVSGILELAGFLVFYLTVSDHRPASAGSSEPRRPEPWMMVVICGTIGFLATLLVNLAVTIKLSIWGNSPAVPLVLDQQLLMLPMWAFLVPTVWGFNARWLPIFLGVRAVRPRLLYAAVTAAWAAAALMLFGYSMQSTLLLPVASILSVSALGTFSRSVRQPKLNGVHSTFTIFVRIAYVWLLIASLLSVSAALFDRSGGIWGASRHALTVGFLAVMVFSIGPKILPAFCGARVLFSPKLMCISLVLLNAGCLMRVCSEISAYEGYSSHAWSVLPVSAVIELAAVTVFALNLAITFVRPPAHLMHASV